MSEKDVIKETRPRMETVIDDFRRKLAICPHWSRCGESVGHGDG